MHAKRARQIPFSPRPMKELQEGQIGYIWQSGVVLACTHVCLVSSPELGKYTHTHTHGSLM